MTMREVSIYAKNVQYRAGFPSRWALLTELFLAVSNAPLLVLQTNEAIRGVVKDRL